MWEPKREKRPICLNTKEREGGVHVAPEKEENHHKVNKENPCIIFSQTLHPLLKSTS